MRATQCFLYFPALAVLLLLSAAAAAAAAKELCNPQEKKTLLEIKKNHNYPLTIDYWNASTDCCTDWFGVTCDPTTNRIDSFTAFDNFFLTSIPSALADLPYLTSVDIRKLPNLTGPIPRSLSRLHHLQFLRLDWNSLTGPVPDFLHTLRNLSYINLSFNQLSGTIPPSLALAPSLDFLRLDRNRLTGPIPDTFGSIHSGSVFRVDLSHNRLSGPIPASMGNMNFSILYLARNNLTGDASFLFGESKSVMFLDLSRNSLSFDMSKIKFPWNVEWLLLEHNKIYGSLPSSMAGLQNMNNFNVSYNRLCGKIPTGGRLGEFDQYSFFHNKCLCGSPLPACG